jgi:ribonucrease Y
VGCAEKNSSIRAWHLNKKYMWLPILLGFAALIVGGLGGYYYRQKRIDEKNKHLIAESEKIFNDAQNKAKDVIYEARNEALKLQEQIKKEEHESQVKLNEMEERLLNKEESLDKKMSDTENMREELDNKITSVKQLREEIEGIYKLQSQQLEKIASMSKDEAKELLLKKVESEAKEDIVVQIKKAEKELEEQSQEKAKWIIADAIARCASETTAESTATIVNLPNDEMKGRIIGREGRNINTFEQITGVDVIIDDTPGSIVISGFDLVRRYIAKLSLERLIEDGRIHPARIEEVVEKVKGEVNVLIKELGRKSCA